MTYHVEVMKDILAAHAVAGIVSWENLHEQLGSDFIDFSLWLESDKASNPYGVALDLVFTYLECAI